MLRSEVIEALEDSRRLRRLRRSLGNAMAFRRSSGTRWWDMVREGLSMRRTRGLRAEQVLMAANTPMLLRASMVDGRPEAGVMATGQVVGLIDDLPSCAELIERIMAQASAVLDSLAPVSPSGPTKRLVG